VAVLECATEWAALPSSEGLTLSRLASAGCFGPLLRALDLGAVPLAADPAPFFKEARPFPRASWHTGSHTLALRVVWPCLLQARLSFELCRAALELEQARPPSNLANLAPISH
jgi:hypothetical protein